MGQQHGIKAARALTVDGQARHMLGQARRQRRQPRRVAASAKGVGQDHLIHLCGVDPRIGKASADHRGGEVVNLQPPERPALRDDGGAAGGDDPAHVRRAKAVRSVFPDASMGQSAGRRIALGATRGPKAKRSAASSAASEALPCTSATRC